MGKRKLKARFLAAFLSAAMAFTSVNFGPMGSVTVFAEEVAVLAAGDYYIQNTATGRFLNGGNSWGTQASALSYGQLLTLSAEGANFLIKSGQYFMKNDGYMDGAEADKATLTIAECGDGSFTIAKSDGQYLTASNDNTVAAFQEEKTDLSEWRFLTREEFIAEAAEHATEENPADVTSLVMDSDFSRNNPYFSSWKSTVGEHASDSNKNSPGKGGQQANQCVEAYHKVFDFVQTIENIPNGVYEMNVQGFCRADDGSSNPAVYYINETEKALMGIGDDNTVSSPPNNMDSSSQCFSDGAYTNEFITATVTDHTLKIGVKTADKYNWVIWDNFTLRLKSAEEGSEEYVSSLFRERFDKEQGILGSNLGYNRIRKDLSLAKTVNAMHGSVVEWSSGNPGVISNDGAIQADVANGASVTMTAKVKENAASETSVYTWEYPVRIAKTVAVPEAGKVYDFNSGLGGAAALSGETWALKDYQGEVQYGAGKSGAESDKALLLDGTYGLELPHYNADAANGGWSVSLWYQPTEIINNSAILFVGYGDREKEKWLGVAGDGTDGLKAWWNDKTDGSGSAAWMQEGISKIKPQTGKWNMLTLTQSAIADGTSTVKAYVDGELYATMSHTRSFLEGEDQTIYLGANFWDPSFKALIDDVAVYGKELTAAQVGENFLSSLEEAELKSRVDAFLKGKILGENASLDKVTKNMTLPSSYLGQQITWSNSNDKALTIADGVASVANTGGILPESTVLTYTVAYGDGITGSFEVKAGTENSFIAAEFLGKETDEQDSYIKEELEKAMLNGNMSLNQVVSDLTLPQTVSFKGLDVASVTWASSDAVINVEETPGAGKVVYEDSVSKEVTLTAAVTYLDSADGAEHKAAIAILVKVVKPVNANPVDMGNCQGNAAGKDKTSTTMEVGVSTTNAAGSEYCAPRINDVSLLPGSGDTSPVGNNRIGYLVYNVADIIKGGGAEDKDLSEFDVDTLEYATLKLNVASVNGNLGNWKMKVGLYLVDPEKIDGISNTDQSTYAAVGGAYDKDHVTWCNEWLSKTSQNVGITFDVKGFVKDAIANGQEKIAFRLQVPSAQVIVTGLGDADTALHPSTIVQFRKVMTAEEKAQADADTLAGSVHIPAKLDEDCALALPAVIGEFRSHVTWTSDDEAIAFTKAEEANVYRAAVTRPKDADAAVTVTASVQNGEGQAVNKTFDVSVEKYIETTELGDKLLADFSFDDEQSGLAGKDAVATVNGSNSRYEDGKFGKALYLGGQTWLDVTKNDGEKTALLRGKEELTVSYYSKSDFADTTKGSWTFFAARNGDNISGDSGRHYLAVLDAKKAVKAERYEANSGHNFKQEELENEWRKVDLVASAEKTVLYIDGQKVKETSGADNIQALTTILGESGGVLYIGKATWGSGEYYEGLLDEYKIYDRALTSEEVGRLYQRDQELLEADTKLAAAKAALSKPTIGENDTITLVTEDAENGCTIAWSVPENDSIAIAADGKTAKVTRSEEDAYVTLTATITYKTDLVEKTDTKEFEIHVPKVGGKTDAELAAERVAAVKALLQAPVIGDDDTITFVTENTEYSCTITWSAPADSAVKIAADGKTATVVRGDEESEVTLTATIRGKVLTTVSDTKTFTITIPAKEVDEETQTARAQLAAAVKDAKAKFDGTKAEDYPDGVWKALSDAIEAADEAAKTGTVDTIAAAKTELDNALKNFKTKTEIAEETAKKQAVSDLTAAINTKKPTGTQNDYSPESWAAYQKALADAQAMLKNPNATSAQINEAKAALEKAFNGLDPRKDPQPEPPAQATKVSSIKFTAKTYQIAAGKKIDLGKLMTVKPANAANKKVNFTITKKDGKYASVTKNGVVTTKKAGKGKTVTVTATAADGSGKKAAVKIKIMKNAVTKLTVKKKTLTVKAGKKATIKVTVKTNGKNVNKKLAYTSSNTKYATVNSKGVVSAKKAGKGKTVTITIKTTDGTNKSVKVKVKIKK